MTAAFAGNPGAAAAYARACFYALAAADAAEANDDDELVAFYANVAAAAKAEAAAAEFEAEDEDEDDNNWYCTPRWDRERFCAD